VTHLARWVAALAVAAIAGLAWIERGDIEPAQGESTYRYAGANPVLRYTSGASRRAVTLDDGTRVYLDVASIIDVRFDTTRRTVTLVQGRALFDAAHDAVRPFVVTVGSDRVTALGTLFQVDRSPSELVVTLAQGSVSVTNQTSDETIRLSPGEELRLSASGTHWSTRSVDTQSATSWAQF
jgi:transmembrane sensor